jgi:outer membrane protein assembly factor BamB
VFLFDATEGKEVLRALDASTARDLWSEPVDQSFQDEQGPSGPRCTPVVEGDRIYAQSCRGELQCRLAATGQLLWRTNYLRDFGSVLLGEDSPVPGAAEHGYTASPLPTPFGIVACVGGTNGAGIVCFDRQSGAVRWRSQNDLAAYAAPIRATLGGRDQIVCFTVEGVIALRPEDGGLLWRVPLKTSYGRNVLTPIVVEDWVVAGSYKAGLIGIHVSSAAGATLQAVPAWTNRAAAMNFSSPVAMGRRIYGLGPARNLVCVEIDTGKIAWSKEGLWSTPADAAYGAFIVVGTQLMAWTDLGEIVLLDVASDGCRERARAQVCGRNWCSPAFAEGRLWVRDGLRAGGTAVCVELFPKP